jgi:hypothetical protein
MMPSSIRDDEEVYPTIIRRFVRGSYTVTLVCEEAVQRRGVRRAFNLRCDVRYKDADVGTYFGPSIEEAVTRGDLSFDRTLGSIHDYLKKRFGCAVVGGAVRNARTNIKRAVKERLKGRVLEPDWDSEGKRYLMNSDGRL